MHARITKVFCLACVIAIVFICQSTQAQTPPPNEQLRGLWDLYFVGAPDDLRETELQLAPAGNSGDAITASLLHGKNPGDAGATGFGQGTFDGAELGVPGRYSRYPNITATFDGVDLDGELHFADDTSYPFRAEKSQPEITRIETWRTVSWGDKNRGVDAPVMSQTRLNPHLNDLRYQWDTAVVAGNLPVLSVVIRGNNLPTHLYANRLLETSDEKIFSFGNAWKYRADGALVAELVFRADTEPGLKTLYLNGTPIEWEFKYDLPDPEVAGIYTYQHRGDVPEVVHDTVELGSQINFVLGYSVDSPADTVWIDVKQQYSSNKIELTRSSPDSPSRGSRHYILLPKAMRGHWRPTKENELLPLFVDVGDEIGTHFNGKNYQSIRIVAPSPIDTADSQLRSLRFLTPIGKETESVTIGQLIKLQARFRDAPSAELVEVQVSRSESDSGTPVMVALSKTDDPEVLESSLLRVVQDMPDNSYFSQSLGEELNVDASQKILGRLAGEWAVHDLVADEASAKAGIASVSADGTVLTVALGNGEELQYFAATDVYAQESVDNDVSYLRIRALLERAPSIEALARDMDGTLPQFTNVAVPGSGSALEVTLGEAATSIAVEESKIERNTIQLQLAGRNSTEILKGKWEAHGDADDSAMTPERGNANQIWSRQNPVVIDYAVLLDDQMHLRHNPDNPEGRTTNYSYPYDARYGRTDGSAIRTIVVFGDNLPSAATADLVSTDDNITYSAPTLPPNLAEALRLAALQFSDKQSSAEQDWLVVRAALLEEVRPGIKSFTVDGRIAKWGLAFSDQFGELRFLRDNTSFDDPFEGQFYVGEKISIAARALSEILPIDGTKAILEAVTATDNDFGNANRRQLGIIELSTSLDGSRFAATSDSFTLRRESIGSASALNGNDSLTVTLAENEYLVARTADPLTFFAVPPQSIATVIGEPQNPGLWQSALDRVAACKPGGPGPSNSEFPARTSFTTSRTLLTEWFATREAKIKNGDHAALLLIRDALVPMVEAENAKLLPYLNTGDPARAALRYLNDSRSTPGTMQNAFWTSLYGNFSFRVRAGRVTASETVAFALREAADMPALRDKINDRISKFTTEQEPVNIPDTRDFALAAIAQHLQKQYDAANAAVDRARAAGDCKVEELLVIAGQKADKAVSKILPQLMQATATGWQTDIVARGYVKTVYKVGDEVRALDDWADLDDAYKSMAIALVATPIAAAGSLAAATEVPWLAYAGTATATGAAAANLADAIYFGAKDVANYTSGEVDYETALGLSPILGADVLADAEGRRSNAALAAIGVIAPALGTVGDLKALSDIKSIERGRALSRMNGALENLRHFGAQDRADIAAYYAHLKSTDESRFGRLLGSERQDLEKIETIVRRENPVIDEMTEAETFVASGATEVYDQPDFAPLVPDQSMSSFDADAETFFGDSFRDRATLAEQMETLGFQGQERPVIPAATDESLIGKPVSQKLAGARDENAEFATITGESAAQPFVVNGESRLRPGTAIRRTSAEDSEDFLIGDIIGAGTSSAVYQYRNSDGTVSSQFVVKERKLRGDELALAESGIAQVEAGRYLLEEVAKIDGSMIHVARQEGDALILQSLDGPDTRHYITVEENISEQINGETVTNMRERIMARDPTQNQAGNLQMEELEQLTLQRVIRQLNDQGIVWTDSKLLNFDIRKSDKSPTGYEVVFFDFDGFMPIRQSAFPDEPVAQVARRYQQTFDSFEVPRDAVMYVNGEIHVNNPFDYRIFGTPNQFKPGTSAYPNKNGISYSTWNNLPNEIFLETVQDPLMDSIQSAQ